MGDIIQFPTGEEPTVYLVITGSNVRLWVKGEDGTKHGRNLTHGILKNEEAAQAYAEDLAGIYGYPIKTGGVFRGVHRA